MVAGGNDLLQIVLHQLPVVDVGQCQGSEPDDGVHGGANVVGHAVEESGLGIVGILGLPQSLRQHQFLHLFLPDGLIDVPEPGQDEPFLPEIALLHMDIGKLVIVHLVPVLHPVVSLIIPARLQLPQHIFQGKGLLQTGLILLIHPLPDIPVHDHVISELLLHIPVEPRGHIAHHLDNPCPVPPDIYRKDVDEITAQRIHDGKLLQQLPVGLLRGL